MSNIGIDDLVRRAREIAYQSAAEFDYDLSRTRLSGHAGLAILNVLYVEANAHLPHVGLDGDPAELRIRQDNADRLRGALAAELDTLVDRARGLRYECLPGPRRVSVTYADGCATAS